MSKSFCRPSATSTAFDSMSWSRAQPSSEACTAFASSKASPVKARNPSRSSASEAASILALRAMIEIIWMCFNSGFGAPGGGGPRDDRDHLDVLEQRLEQLGGAGRRLAKRSEQRAFGRQRLREAVQPVGN